MGAPPWNEENYRLPTSKRGEGVRRRQVDAENRSVLSRQGEHRARTALVNAGYAPPPWFSTERVAEALRAAKLVTAADALKRQERAAFHAEKWNERPSLDFPTMKLLRGALCMMARGLSPYERRESRRANVLATIHVESGATGLGARFETEPEWATLPKVLDALLLLVERTPEMDLGARLLELERKANDLGWPWACEYRLARKALERVKQGSWVPGTTLRELLQSTSELAAHVGREERAVLREFLATLFRTECP